MSAALFWPTASTVIAKGGEYNNDRGPNHTPRYHQGCDVAVGVSTAIYGSGDGTVTAVINTGKTAGYGLYVKVRYIVSGLTVDVINSHMSRADVRVGQAVSVSTQLGISGGTRGTFGAGDATGPHDHLELRANGALSDPHNYLSPRSQIASGGSTLISEEENMARILNLRQTNDGTNNIATIFFDGGPGIGIKGIASPAHLSLLQRYLADKPGDHMYPAELTLINQYLTPAPPSMDPAPVVTAVTAAIKATGVSVDVAAIAKAVDAVLADDFAAAPKLVLDAEAERLKQ